MLRRIQQALTSKRTRLGYLVLLAIFFLGAYVMRPAFGQAGKETSPAVPTLEAAPGVTAVAHAFRYFSPLRGSGFSTGEKVALGGALLVALAAIAYARLLVKQVVNADRGTPKMQAIAAAVREGANAYLRQQLKVVAILIGVIVFVLFFSRRMAGGDNSAVYALGRAWAFLMGACFSAAVGLIGMRMATTGNLRVAAAAPVGFGRALMLGYRSGTITGMMTDGLGLLGGTIIFMIYGEHAYEALLGFGFGGTLLALFMRVGGGIYTKAADVGADLVGKIEKDIPEDDPRNAATIADNVGDNVGDCAGMAADIFESYEVTMVAAMILGWASFGHKGVMFPILVRAIGVIGSIISTYTVRAGDKGDVRQAMKQINKGFLIGSAISIVGFITLGYFYLNFTTSNAPNADVLANIAALPAWCNFGIVGLDMRPAWTCLIGIVLCIALNRTTEYFTGTEYEPVRGIKRATDTGHGTTIIEGFAVGYESAVATGVTLCAAIFASVLIYSTTMDVVNPIFIAYGVAMCGIGMLTLTGNTVSMDVFGPIADNANGIAEMGYEVDGSLIRDEKHLKESRQILADLDAVGNTTKAVTKGVAIGSAVIAAFSLFASFITVIGSGGGGEEKPIPLAMFNSVAGLLNVSNPNLLIGMLVGGAVPFLFSSMLIRAVGRAAFLIVKECRNQFHDKAIWAGTKKPDYAKVVGICTGAAQKELVGPALLGVLSPVLVGYFLGPIGLAGFLAGSIVAGQLLASFMCNAGGAWDNAKKMIEDDPRSLTTGKGSEPHKASVTGDTVGDPLKDTAGPAVNPLLKVMNMVAVLAVPLMLGYDRVLIDAVNKAARENNVELSKTLSYVGFDSGRIAVILVTLGVMIWAVWQSKRGSKHQAAPVELEVEDVPKEVVPSRARSLHKV
jgi:K(+)-stimulated pyrophosphate-energized sodium pump